MTNILSVESLRSGYGELPVLEGITFDVGQGEIFSVVGANGAGKTTLLLTIGGHLQAKSGRVMFDGQDITNLPAHQAAERGLVMVPEGGRLFPFMTVLENLQMGASLDNLVYFKDDVEKVFHLFPRLKERITQRGGTLSGGEQQMLSIGRALMARPKLLLLDEPSLGLAPLIVKQIFEAIKELNANQGLTVFLVEQNAFGALKLAHRGYVMVNGMVTLSGSGKELLANPEVRAAYLEGGRH